MQVCIFLSHFLKLFLTLEMSRASFLEIILLKWRLGGIRSVHSGAHRQHPVGMAQNRCRAAVHPPECSREALLPLAAAVC